jgi:hypothetical protein
MPPSVDLTGRVFHRLSVLYGPVSKIYSGKRRTFWLCECECGKMFEALGESLVSGNTKSCGCLLIEKARITSKTHGRSRTKEYNAWAAARSRCTNQNHPCFQSYGGRGIYMCDEWSNSFEAFLEDMGEAPWGLELERVDNDGPYAKWNCKWATRSEQSSNQRRWIRGAFTYQGQSVTLADVVRRTGLHRASIQRRMRVYGDTLDDAVSRLQGK